MHLTALTVQANDLQPLSRLSKQILNVAVAQWAVDFKGPELGVRE